MILRNSYKFAWKRHRNPTYFLQKMTAMATKEKFITNLLAPWGECLYSIFVEMCVRKLFSLGVYSFFKLVLAMPLFPETECIALNNLFLPNAQRK